MISLFDKTGKAIAYVADDNKHIYLYDGKPVAFLKRDEVYSFLGRYLGWIQNGWLYDKDGNPALFMQSATGGPARPTAQYRPARSSRKVKPVKPPLKPKPARPRPSTSWSDLSNTDYFEQ